MASITQRKNTIYKLEKYFLYIPAVMLMASLTILGKDYAHIGRLVFLTSIILLLIRWIIAPFLNSRIDNAVYEKFSRLFPSQKYFSTPCWIKAYREYCAKHPPRRVSATGLKTDLSLKYICRIIKRDWYIPAFAIPGCAVLFSSNHDMVTAAVAETVYFSTLLVMSGRPYRRWLKNAENRGYHCDEINNSYLSGQAFVYSYNTLVIGEKFLHTFDGSDFHTVEKNNIREILLGVERITVQRYMKYGYIYLRDEYRFSMTFFHEGGYRDFAFSLVLNQFQIKQILDKFFPGVPVRDATECNRSRINSFLIAPLCDPDSYPVIDDSQNDTAKKLLRKRQN